MNKKIIALVLIFGMVVPTGTSTVLAAERYSPVNTGEFTYIPPRREQNPEVQNRAYAQEALSIVFSDEIKNYPGLAIYLTDQTSMPFVRALADMKNLRTQKSGAATSDLVTSIRTAKASYLGETGIQIWMDSYRLPKISSFAPQEGIVGDTITLRGENLKDAIEVRFRSASAQPKVISDTQLQVTVPGYSGGIQFPIEVRTRYGTAQSATSFTQLTGQCDDSRITRAFWELRLQKPRGDGKTGECDPSRYGVFEKFDEMLRAIQQQIGYVKRLPPQITGVYPETGPAGKKVFIDGFNLFQLKAITFGGVAAAAIISESEFRVSATVPPGGNGRIMVSTFSGDSVWKTPFELAASPKIENVTPLEAIVGDTLRVKGQNFGYNPIVQIGESMYPVLLKTTNEIHLKLTSPFQNKRVTISTVGGTAEGNSITVWDGKCRDPWIVKAFEELLEVRPYGADTQGQCDPSRYNNGSWNSYEQLKFAVRQRYGYAPKPTPRILNIEPSTGIADTWVTVRGENFDDVQSVIIGNMGVREMERKSSTEIRAKIPFGTGGGEVVVSTLHGVGRYAGFGVVYPPSISNVDPSTALAGETVLIRGAQLAEAAIAFASIPAEVVEKSATKITVKVPKGLKGFVDITATSAQGRSSWGPFGIVSAQFTSPTNSLRDARLVLTAPDGSIKGSIPLIGNAGAGLSDAQISSLLGNTGAALIGNSGAGLIGNAGASLSVQDIAGLIGNAGAGLLGNTGAALMGNAGASLSAQDIATLIGNAGSGLMGNAGAGLIGNAGSSLIGNTGAALIGNSGAGLIGNAGASLIVNAGAGRTTRGVQNLDSPQVPVYCNEWIPRLFQGTCEEQKENQVKICKPFLPKIWQNGCMTQEEYDAQESLQTPQPSPNPLPTEKNIPNSSTEEQKPIVPSRGPEVEGVIPEQKKTIIEKPVIEQKKEIQPLQIFSPKLVEKKVIEKTPEKIITPPTQKVDLPKEEKQIETPIVIQPKDPEVPPTQGKACNPDIPKYQQPGCIETVEVQKRSPYDGLPCPGDSVPNYAKAGCIQ